jgi:hypothetical protein
MDFDLMDNSKRYHKLQKQVRCVWSDVINSEEIKLGGLHKEHEVTNWNLEIISELG